MQLFGRSNWNGEYVCSTYINFFTIVLAVVRENKNCEAKLMKHKSVSVNKYLLT